MRIDQQKLEKLVVWPTVREYSRRFSARWISFGGGERKDTYIDPRAADIRRPPRASAEQSDGLHEAHIEYATRLIHALTGAGTVESMRAAVLLTSLPQWDATKALSELFEGRLGLAAAIDGIRDVSRVMNDWLDTAAANQALQSLAKLEIVRAEVIAALRSIGADKDPRATVLLADFPCLCIPGAHVVLEILPSYLDLIAKSEGKLRFAHADFAEALRQATKESTPDMRKHITSVIRAEVEALAAEKHEFAGIPENIRLNSQLIGFDNAAVRLVHIALHPFLDALAKVADVGTAQLLSDVCAGRNDAISVAPLAVAAVQLLSIETSYVAAARQLLAPVPAAERFAVLELLAAHDDILFLRSTLSRFSLSPQTYLNFVESAPGITLRWAPREQTLLQLTKEIAQHPEHLQTAVWVVQHGTSFFGNPTIERFSHRLADLALLQPHARFIFRAMDEALAKGQIERVEPLLKFGEETSGLSISDFRARLREKIGETHVRSEPALPPVETPAEAAVSTPYVPAERNARRCLRLIQAECPERAADFLRHLERYRDSSMQNVLLSAKLSHLYRERLRRGETGYVEDALDCASRSDNPFRTLMEALRLEDEPVRRSERTTTAAPDPSRIIPADRIWVYGGDYSAENKAKVLSAFPSLKIRFCPSARRFDPATLGPKTLVVWNSSVNEHSDYFFVRYRTEESAAHFRHIKETGYQSLIRLIRRVTGNESLTSAREHEQ